MQSSYFMIRVTPTALVNKLAELRFLRCVQHTGNRTNNATPSASVTDVIKTSNTTVSTVTEPVQIPPTTRHDTTRHDTTRHDTTRHQQDLGPATNIATADPNPNRTPGIKFARQAAIGWDAHVPTN